MSLAIVCTLLGVAANAAPVLAAPAPGARAKPVTGSTFALTIDGYEIATFEQLVSISSSIEPGGKGGTKKASMILRRKVTNSIELSAWHELVLQGDANVKKNATLTVRSGAGTPVMRFNLTKAFPVKVEITGEPGSSTLMETVTFTCDTLVRVSP